MKKILAVLFVTLMFSSFAYAGDELEKLQSDYDQVVAAFTENVNAQRLMVEGFKATSPTFRSLVNEQIRLQGIAKKLTEQIKELKAPAVEEEVEADTE